MEVACKPCGGRGFVSHSDESGFIRCAVCMGRGKIPGLTGGEANAVEEFVEAMRPKDVYQEAMRPVELGSIRFKDVYQQLREGRQKDYGDPFSCHASIGAAWGAILGQSGYTRGDLVQARTVALMLAAMKLMREAYSHKQDNLDDAVVYLKFAGEFAESK